MALFNVIIAGAGIAGIEGLLRLRRIAGDEVRVTVLSPSDEFVYRPLAVLEPFSHDSLRRYPLAGLLADAGAEHVRDRLARVDADFGLVATADGRELPYDALLVALGAGESNPFAHAVLFTDHNSGETFHSVIGDLQAGHVTSVTFVVPNWLVWPLPLYELALLTAHHAQAVGIDAELTFLTTEARPLKAFGQAAGDAIVGLLDDAGIVLRTGASIDVPGPGRLGLDGEELYADRIVTLPRITGPAVPGLPAGTNWFTPIDDYCRVPGIEGHVFAAGDATDFPVKHGGLGAQQADTAAAGIAHLAGIGPRPAPLAPVIRSTLLTGETPLYLTACLQGDLGWSSAVHERAPWPIDHKLVAEELSPYLAGLDSALAAQAPVPAR